MIRNNNAANQPTHEQMYMNSVLNHYITANDPVDICSIMIRNGLKHMDVKEFIKYINTQLNGGVPKRFIAKMNKIEANVVFTFFASNHQQATLTAFEDFISDNHNDIGNNGHIFTDIRNAVQRLSD